MKKYVKDLQNENYINKKRFKKIVIKPAFCTVLFWNSESQNVNFWNLRFTKYRLTRNNVPLTRRKFTVGAFCYYSTLRVFYCFALKKQKRYFCFLLLFGMFHITRFSELLFHLLTFVLLLFFLIRWQRKETRFWIFIVKLSNFLKSNQYIQGAWSWTKLTNKRLKKNCQHFQKPTIG